MTDLNTIHHGDCLQVLKTLADNSVDSIVTDPPYGLGKEPDALAMLTDWMQGRDYVPKGKGGFMGKEWDSFVPQPAIWRECLRVLKPGGHIVAFAGTRTQHLMALGLQIAGFEIRDMLAWISGSGFPKSANISKQIDKTAGATREVIGENPNHRPVSGTEYVGVYAGANTGAAAMTAPATDAAKQWDGWGTALKPALETITLARKPFPGTVAANVQQHGTGALNIDGCRIAAPEGLTSGGCKRTNSPMFMSAVAGVHHPTDNMVGHAAGRWPANLLHDGSPEVLAGFPTTKSGKLTAANQVNGGFKGTINCYGTAAMGGSNDFAANSGSAARFFYCGKASKKDRDEGNGHPTVKPTAVMQWLCRLITPPGGVVLDPFTGSGSTLKAAIYEGFKWVGIEREAEYVEIAKARCARAVHDMGCKGKQGSITDLPLFQNQTLEMGGRGP